MTRYKDLLGSILVDRWNTRVILTVIALLTFVFGVCWWLMEDGDLSSWDPPGPDVELQYQIDNIFPQRNHVVAFILESRTGDIFEPSVLRSLYDNELALRKAYGGYLIDQYDVVNDRQILGIFTIADAVQKTLRASGRAIDIYNATEKDINDAISEILSNDIGGELITSMASDLRVVEELSGESRWVASAMTIFVSLDNEKLGGGRSTFSLTSDPRILQKESINRDIQTILRGNQDHYDLWGLAIDTNLEAMDEGQKSIPYVFIAIILVTAVAALSLRSWIAFFVIGLGLFTLLVWLEGISHILALKQSVTTDLIVPIAMVSLGVDFFIHSVSRYQESRAEGLGSRIALASAIVGISGALTLAMLSDGIAFLANLTSNIDAIVGFGLSAGIAVIASYLIMGWVMPVVLLEIEEIMPGRELNKRPIKHIYRESFLSIITRIEDFSLNFAMLLSKKPFTVVVVCGGLTSACFLVSLNIQPEFDIKDFFSYESDLVQGLDKLDYHMDGELLGEPIFLLVKIDARSSEWLGELKALNQNLSKSEFLTKDPDGDLFLYLPSLDSIMDRFAETRYAIRDFGYRTDEQLSGANILEQGIFSLGKSKELLMYLYENGVQTRTEVYYFEPSQIQEMLQQSEVNKNEFLVLISVGALGTREQSQVPEIRTDIEEIIQQSDNELGLQVIGVTGSPFIRNATLAHTTGLMKISVPVAIMACFLMLVLWMRSILFAVATVIPVGCAVFWILAFMVVAGLNVNFVTATIASVTIGVGIDFSIHITQRFRQELRKEKPLDMALEHTIRGTGKALFGSALSSMIGFSVLLLAPMPIIATYGLLTSIMILIAMAGALLMLPSILLIISLKTNRSE